MPYIGDLVLDAALDFIDSSAEYLYICNAEPANYADAQTNFALGSKANPPISAPEAGDVSGRKIVIAAIADGTVSATDDATHWALTDNSESLLLAAGPLDALQAVTNGNVFTLTEFDIEFPDPA